MEVTITKDCITFDGKWQTDEIGSRGFCPKRLVYTMRFVKWWKGIEKGVIANFNFDARDKQRSIFEYFRIIFRAMYDKRTPKMA
jgi:hypothetical protein